MATCEDEDSRKYFEGATWFVGNCIKCNCTEGKISCNREIRIITSNEEMLTEDCNQTNCNMVEFLETKKGVCAGN